MSLLEKHKDLLIEHHAEIEKDHQWKIIGSQKRRPGMKMYAYDPEKNEVYEVEIVKKEAVDVSKNVYNSLKAEINPKHPLLWSINRKNAVRKFIKYLKLDHVK